MTETRKQIIEFIEPYMDKTLSDGCIIEINKSYSYWNWKNIEPYFSIFNKFGGCTYWSGEKDKDWKFKNWWNWDKIIWHYDITAVLKYIDKFKNPFTWNWPAIRVDSWIISFWVWDWLYTKWHNFDKPLHLYSKQEEEELLELLTKLK